MSGVQWALGAVGALAVGAAVRRRGSRSVDGVLSALKDRLVETGAHVELTDVSWYSDDPKARGVYVDQILVPEGDRGHGKGRAAMQILLRWADQHGVAITLTPSPDLGGDVDRLKRWYVSLGFTRNTTGMPGMMAYLPRKPRGRRGSAAKAPLLLWHGSPHPLSHIRAPAFFTDDVDGARWFARDRGGEGEGYLLQAQIDLHRPATTRELIDIARAAGVEVEEDPYFFAPQISAHSSYEGDNPLDLVYVPQVRRALLARGFDGVQGWDLLGNREIMVWITLRDNQATVVDRRGSAARTPGYLEIASDLFRESGVNATDFNQVDRYAAAMKRAGGWARFPPISGQIGTVDAADLQNYRDAEEGGFEHELAWSRPLTEADLGRDYVVIEDGHHRAHAARKNRIPIRVKPFTWNKGPWTAAEIRRYREENP